MRPGFLWGAATSAYQIEGAVNADGRGESIWDRFCHTPGAIEGGATGDIACDHYHRWPGDLDLMAEIGLTAYRFSVSWPRIQPEGRGRLNAPGLDFYSRLVDGLLSRGIAPVVNLYHWDLPQALEDRVRGWTGRETAERFADFAEAVFRRLGDRVSWWLTLNEPWVQAFLGYHQGIHAPGVRDLGAAVRASHHLLLGHGLAVEAYRSLSLGGQIGLALDLQVSSPATDSDEDRRAATLSDGATNRWFLDALLRGAYPSDVAELFAAHGADIGSVVRPGDLATIARPIDFLGMNYYFRRTVSAADTGLGWTEDPAAPRTSTGVTEMGWGIDPDAFLEQLLRLHADYPGMPILVTENGIGLRDDVGPDGSVDDRRRIDYLRDHVARVRQAIDAGVDVRGYFVWTLLDNFEWSFGYRPRFGLVHVDFATQRRTPKASAGWYAKLIRSAGALD
ncbi:MAG TPA: GH1 family beta-glucosidase [Candidatus Polarisedimenticolia bacterium]|nr:GH1 family beta-glucosidase [Candidatus Polarisedimenticolia bacterium]